MRLNLFSRSRYSLSRDAHDCGPAALAAVARFYGKRLSLGRVRALVNPDLQGASLTSIRDAACMLGFSASCGRTGEDQLGNLPLPAIFHLNDEVVGHYVVVLRARPQHVELFDPVIGSLSMGREDFIAKWSKNVVFLKPTEALADSADSNRIWQEIWGFAKGYPWKILGSLGAAVLVTAVNIGASLSVMLILDRVLPRHDLRLWWIYLGAFTIVVLTGGVCAWMRSELLASLSRSVEVQLGRKYIRQVLALPIFFFDRRSIGDVVSRAHDISQLRALLTFSVLSSGVDIFNLLVAASLLLHFSKDLLGVTGVLLLLVVMVGALAAPAIASSERRARMQQTLFTSNFIEIVAAIRIFKASTAEDFGASRLEAAHTQSVEALQQRSRLGGTLSAVSAGSARLGMLYVLFYGARLVMTQQLSVGTLLFFFSVLGLFISAAENLIPSLIGLEEAQISYERLADVDNITPEDVYSTAEAVSGNFSSLTVRNVSFSHRVGYPVLSEVNFEVSAGEVLCILGETGSGKSTLAAIIAGLYEATEGSVSFAKVPSVSMPKRVLRNGVGLVFQDAGLITGSIKENICLGSTNVSKEQLAAALQIAEVQEFVDRLPRGVEYNVGSGGSGVSNGQRQRIALARAALRCPPILILDEATSHLDIATEARVLDALLEQRRGLITIIITHRLATVSRSTHILLLQAGRSVGFGSHASLQLSNPWYRDSWHRMARSATSIM